MTTAIASSSIAMVTTTTIMRNHRKGNHHIEHKPDYNDTFRFELFLLDEGEKKVETKDETRVPNTAVFTFNKEDHTLGNLLSQRLHKYPCVTFSAYKIPHPLFAKFELRISTDGSTTPREILVRCCEEIIHDLDVLNSSFTTEWLGKKIVTEGEQDRIAREQNNF
ncbi:RBP11-like subunits of RNA polymerase [Lojkania enalia]|uniref:RBP11-like subunits of RNA polymerase n=1 Tax=Lojkania enalia TaxID=147567 RepID=A0A9P4KBV3_9PLEO|nr:RBP11-like subunits of RNA polymerase [Didymosphaeria enalia]